MSDKKLNESSLEDIRTRLCDTLHTLQENWNYFIELINDSDIEANEFLLSDEIQDLLWKVFQEKSLDELPFAELCYTLEDKIKNEWKPGEFLEKCDMNTTDKKEDYDLKTINDSRKSFYGKAFVKELPNGDKQLISYNTIVAEIKDGKPQVYGTYSQTTLRHIKEFLKQEGFECTTAKQIMKDYGVNKYTGKKFEEACGEKKLQEGTSNVDELAKFLEEAVEDLKNGGTGTWSSYLGNDLYCVVGCNNADAYDEEDLDKFATDTDKNYVICTKIAVNCDDLQSDYDVDWNMPYEDNGNVYDSEVTISKDEDFTSLAQTILNEYNSSMKDLELDDDGKILSKQDESLNENKKEFTYEDALEIAKTDRDVGVMSAIEKLEGKGFDCSDYFAIYTHLTDGQEVDDEVNLKARDDLFVKLGIKDLMDKAYEEVWDKVDESKKVKESCSIKEELDMNKIVKILNIIANQYEGQCGPFGGKDPIVDEEDGTIEFYSQMSPEVYQFNLDGSVDLLTAEEVGRDLNDDTFADEYSHFNSIEDLFNSGLSWFDLPEKVENKIYKLIGEDKKVEECTLTEKQKKLVEGASNFGSFDNFPLLVFDTDENVSEAMRYDSDYPKREDYEDEAGNFDEEKYWSDLEDFEEKYYNEYPCVILSYDDYEGLKDDIDDFNAATTQLAYDIYDSEDEDDENDYYILESDLKVEIEPGYYQAAQLTVDEKNFDYLSEKRRQEQIDRFNKFFEEMKDKYKLTKLGVAWGPASNGETGYKVIEKKKEKVNVDKKLREETNIDDIDLLDRTVRIINTGDSFEGKTGEVIEDNIDTVVVRVNYKEGKNVIQDFYRENVELV